MRIAYLITAHTNPEQLKRLVMSLQHPDADFYLYIDGKVPLVSFLSIAHLRNVYFIQNRIPIYWGGYSQVQSTLIGLSEILKTNKEYGHINFLSGSDYPIKSTAFIHDYLAAHPNNAFMDHRDIYQEWPAAVYRISKYDLGYYRIPRKASLQKLINGVTPNRTLPYRLVPFGGSAWFSMPSACARYILQYITQHPALSRFFKLTWGSDEVIFQTILVNSPFRKTLVDNDLRYIDWSQDGPSPKLLTQEDAAPLCATDDLWARKFDAAASGEVLDYLDELRKSH